MMNFTETTLKVLAATENGMIKSNAQFWQKFSDKEIFDREVIVDSEDILKTKEKLQSLFSGSNELGMICAFDSSFPKINSNVKNNSEKPYLLFYYGDISLLEDLNNNVAVIGLTDPDEEVKTREISVVKEIVKNRMTIVSGLAKGCDSIAHRISVEEKGKTIAILPSPLSNIFPAENRDLAQKIIDTGGLLVTEYLNDPKSRFEAIDRFVKRDRLQAMFSKAIILIASYRKGEGDSGSRHAMLSAKKYKIDRYALYDKKIDEQDTRFGLNKDLINNDKVKVLKVKSIIEISNLKNPNISVFKNSKSAEQLTIL